MIINYSTISTANILLNHYNTQLVDRSSPERHSNRGPPLSLHGPGGQLPQLHLEPMELALWLRQAHHAVQGKTSRSTGNQSSGLLFTFPVQWILGNK